MQRTHAWYIGTVLLATAVAAAASDYAREKKWADEILPGLMNGESVYLEAKGHMFLGLHTVASAGESKARGALIVVHGLGVHPDWSLIGTLRSQLSEHGYTTLSIQMPILDVDAKAESYTGTLPEAAARLDAATTWLRHKGYKKVAIVAHSMGARMSHHYLAQHDKSPVDAWVAIGTPIAFGPKDRLTLPIFDLFGENDLPQVLDNAAKRAKVLAGNPRSRQLKTPHTDHFFTGKDAELVSYVQEFLDATL